MRKRIKILFTTSNFNTAGSGKVIYDLIQGLDKTKFDIAIACGTNAGEFFKTIETLGVPVFILSTKTAYRPYYNLLPRIWQISKFYKQHEFDIVHSWQWSSDWTEALAAKLVGAKWLYTKKAMGFNSRHWKIKSYLADYIVTINDEMPQYFPYKKAQQLIPLGIDTDYYNPELFEQPESNGVCFKIISIANMVPVKGIEVLLKSLALLNDTSVHLTVLGAKHNGYSKQMEQLANTLGVANQVDFLGKQADVRPYLVEADLFVIPTLDQGRKEGMPMALVEAMSMGIPVLGSDITGIKFVLKDFSQCLFKAGDVTALKSAITILRALPCGERKELGESLRAYVKSHFTLFRFIEAHEQLYHLLILGENDRQI